MPSWCSRSTDRPAAVRPGRDHDYAVLASAPAIEGNARAQERDIEADARFVAALAPMLDQGARERAMAVRVRAGDPAAQLFG